MQVKEITVGRTFWTRYTTGSRKLELKIELTEKDNVDEVIDAARDFIDLQLQPDEVEQAQIVLADPAEHTGRQVEKA